MLFDTHIIRCERGCFFSQFPFPWIHVLICSWTFLVHQGHTSNMGNRVIDDNFHLIARDHHIFQKHLKPICNEYRIGTVIQLCRHMGQNTCLPLHNLNPVCEIGTLRCFDIFEAAGHYPHRFLGVVSRQNRWAHTQISGNKVG